MPSPFVHLHLHSDYSVLDGALRIKDAVAKAKEWEMPALAITDHGNLHGAIAFYKAAKGAGIKPIIGMEAYITTGNMRDRTKNPTGRGDGLHHLVLLATDPTGYSNLVQLSSKAYLEGFYYKPRLDKEALAANSAGLIAMTACIKGEIPSLVTENRMDDARRVSNEYRDIFGRENFYLEVQENGMLEQKLANEGLVRLAELESIPLVATNDCHYLLREDSEAQDLLLCIQTGKALDDPNRMRFSSDQFYFKSAEEMIQQLGHLPGAIENTLEIANRCNLKLDLGVTHMPTFPLPPGENRTPYEYLREVVFEGAKVRYGDYPQYILDRIEFELNVIHNMQFDSYFLIVWDFIRFARENGVSVGPGRGSAAGSIVAYCLYITDIEPLANNLLFERFLNPDRVTPPDIDIDFSDETRSKVIRYVTDKYGEENVSQIATFGTLKAKNAIKDVGRALGFTPSECDKITKLMPNTPDLTLDTALTTIPEVKDISRSDERHKRLFKMAGRLEGLIRQTGVHAAGMIISDRKLAEVCPLMRANTGDVCAQYEKGAIEEIGLIKMDFLGLSTLSFIDECLDLLKRDGVTLDVRVLPEGDEPTYALLGRGDTDGVFQVESSGMKDMLRKLGPKTFSDVVALIALYRPGVLGSGMAEDFTQRKNGRQRFEYDHPLLEPILKETYGIILYQEQVMQIANKLAGLSLAEADLMRRAMGKKKKEIILEMEDKFVAGAKELKVPEKTAKKVFELIGYFGGYGFNKSHSAAYAVLVYQTAYLKANYPLHFMAALLTSAKDSSEKLRYYMLSAREKGLSILPPCVNVSGERFSVSGGAIRFGLGAIKNVGIAAVQAIINERQKNGAFKNLMDFCERVGTQCLSSKLLETLIRSGAFDCFGAKRSQLLAIYKDILERSASILSDRETGQSSLFEAMGSEDESNNDMPPLPEMEELDRSELLTNEKELLGVYISGHPLDLFAKEIELLANTNSRMLQEQENVQSLTLVGLVSAVRKKNTKKGDRMAIVDIEDGQGTMEVVVFPELYLTATDILRDQQVVFIEATGERRSEGVNVVASRIARIEDERLRLIGTLHIVLELSELNDGLIPKLEFVIGRNSGLVPVIFHVQTQEEELVIRAGPHIRIKPGPLLNARLTELVGDRFYYEIGSPNNHRNRE